MKRRRHVRDACSGGEHLRATRGGEVDAGVPMTAGTRGSDGFDGHAGAAETLRDAGAVHRLHERRTVRGDAERHTCGARTAGEQHGDRHRGRGDDADHATIR